MRKWCLNTFFNLLMVTQSQDRSEQKLFIWWVDHWSARRDPPLFEAKRKTLNGGIDERQLTFGAVN
jgi:hypothetical protein